MKQKINKLFSAILVLIMILSQSSSLISTLYASSEIKSESSEVLNSEVTSESTNLETPSEVVDAEITTDNLSLENAQSDVSEVSDTQIEERDVTSKDTRAYSDMSGLGNQNTSAVGKGTYLYPNEATELLLKDIYQMQTKDSSKYIAVDDLNQKLIDVATAGETMYEGISMVQFPSSMTVAEKNAAIASNLTFSGTCWIDNNANVKNIRSKVVPSTNCTMTMEDFGYYYNLQTSVYEPVDLIVDINYLDFFNSPNEFTSKMGVGVQSHGVVFEQNAIDEFEFSLDYKFKDGTSVNVPIFYEHEDFDFTISLGFEAEDFYKMTTYYQDPVKPSTPSSGTYTAPKVGAVSGLLENDAQFNFVPVYNYAKKNNTDGLLSAAYLSSLTRVNAADRSSLNSLAAFDKAGGTYTAADRGWNRLKIMEKDSAITVFDSFGVNAGTGVNILPHYYGMFISDGKDGQFVVQMNSSSTMTFNMNSNFFGIDPYNNTGPGQGSSMRPYTVTDTIIRKSMTDSNGNNIAEVGEDLTYTIQLDNVLEFETVTNVPVRDDMLENLPSYLTWDGTVTVKDGSGNDVAYTGDIAQGTFIVSGVKSQGKILITYTVNLNSYPKAGQTINNIATNRDVDPTDLCTVETQDINCAATTTMIEGNPTIKKAVVDSDNSKNVSVGETLTYTIEVSNPDDNPAYEVAIRDDQLENIPSFVTYNNDVVINGSTHAGDILNGSLILDEVPGGKTVTITYSFTVNDLPNGVTSLLNVVTDNGDDPSSVDPSTCDEIDCATATIDVLPSDVNIKKSVVDSDGSNSVTVGETLTYTIVIENPTASPAYDIPVRDDKLENIPSFVTYNNDVKVSGTSATGSILDGTLVLAKIAGGAKVEITYSFTVNDLPNGVTTLLNVVTDNGDDPSSVDPSTCDEIDCATATIDVLPSDVNIKKSVVDSDGSNSVAVGETLTYTIVIENPTANPAYDIPVRDDKLENIPSFVSYNSDVKVFGTSATGSILDGTLVLAKIAGGAKAEITYSFTINDMPNGVTSLLNVVTDNGDDPALVDPSACDEIDCATATIDVLPSDVNVRKSVVDSDGSNSVAVGETLTYTIVIENPTVNPAYDIPVRDDKLENIPNFVTYNSDVNVSGASVTGSILDGTLVLAKLAGGAKVEITYSFTVNDLPKDTTMLLNVVTDNGDDPSSVDSSSCDETDCATAIINVDPASVKIKKSVVDSDASNSVVVGETLTYTIEVSNSTLNPMYDIPVRDDKLENIPSFLTYNNDVEIIGSGYSGNILDGTLVLDKISGGKVVTITYSFTVEDIPQSVTSLLNVVTVTVDDPTDVDPTTCDETECDTAVINVENSDVNIKKSVVDSDKSNSVSVGETLTYTVEVTNTTSNPVYDVLVRDDKLENIPNFLTYNNDVEITGSGYSGSILDGTLVLDKITGGKTVTITYSFTVEDLPQSITSLLNVVTDDGQNPALVDPTTCDGVDCATASIDLESAYVNIKKSVIDSDKSNKVSVGEVLTYTIEVNNPTINPVYSVPVRDNMLEAVPSFLTFNNDIEIIGATSSGKLTDGTLVLDKISGSKVVTITYSFTVEDLPKEITSLLNVATDNGADPSQVDSESCDEVDCATAIIDVDESDVNIKKTVVLENGNKVVAVGDTLTYTLNVSNPTANPEYDVPVRDSMLENLPSYLKFDEKVKVEGATFSGSLIEGTLVLDKVSGKDFVTITYSITVMDMPKDITLLANIATDNGVDPSTVDPQTCDETDCDQATINVETADVNISKSVVDGDKSGVVTVGETLEYTIEVSNPTGNHAYEIPVRDSMLENLPSYLEFNQEIIVEGSTYTGSFVDGTLVLDKVLAKGSVTITYNIKVVDMPKEVTHINNITTDNGEDPRKVDRELCDQVNCDQTTTAVQRANTHIKKSVADEDGDKLLVVGETLTYTLEISNPTGNHAYDVAVRDSILESLPNYVTFNDDVTISGSTFAGSLVEGTLVLDKVVANEQVTITYSITSNDIPKDATALVNIATDNGYDPATVDPKICDEVDCDDTTTKVEAADTSIKKTITVESNEKLLVVGEALTYTIEVSNPTKSNALNTPVRDSILENLPSYLTFNDDVTIVGSEYTGSLTDGSLILNNVAAQEVVVITYSFTYNDSPKNINQLVNIATDNGDDPATVDSSECDEVDCSVATIEMDPADTTIEKTVLDSDGSGVATVGETLTYTVTVSNPTGNHAYDVAVRDSMLESLPNYVTFNDDVTIDGSTFTGRLVDGTLVLDKVIAYEQVTITYSITANDIPKDATALVNIATDNGDNPTTVDPKICDETDCDDTTTKVEVPDTSIKKTVAVESSDKLLAVGEVLTYTIEVSNPTKSNALNTPVRDSMLENLPSYLTFNDDVTIVGSEYTGSLAEGSLVLNNVAAQELVVITYSFTYNDSPKNINQLVNIATDNGDDPATVDSSECDEVDCSVATIELDPADTIIAKSVLDSDGSGVASVGETLTYTITVSNPTGNHAYDVSVRDDMLELMPNYLTFNNDVEISGSDYSGNLTEGSLRLEAVKAGEAVEIVYSFKINELPENVTAIINIATDNGENPDEFDSKKCTKSTDCASASISSVKITETQTIVETGNKVIAILISSILVLVALLYAKRQVNAKL